MDRKIGLILAFVMVLVLMQIVTADTTTITVQSLPQYTYNISLNIYESINGETVAFMENVTNSEGKAIFSYSSTSKIISFSVAAMQSGRMVMLKRFGSFPNYTTGSSITLNLFDEPVRTVITTPAVTNNSANSSTVANTTTNTSATSPNTTVASIGGNALNNSSNNSPAFILNSAMKLKILIIVGLIILGIVLFFVIKIIRKKYKGGQLNLTNPFPKTKNEDIRTIPFNSPKVELELEEAEKKIKEAQTTIENIRNRKQKILDAQKRVEDAKRELEGLEDF